MVLVGSNPTFEEMVPCLKKKDAYSNLLWTLFPPAREEFGSIVDRAIGDRAVKHLEKGADSNSYPPPSFVLTGKSTQRLVSTITILRRDFHVRVY